jgi:hypothetical protein
MHTAFPTTIVAIIDRLKGTRPTGIKLVSAIAGLMCLIILAVVGLKTDSKALNSDTCQFGYLTYGQVWIRVEPRDPCQPRHTSFTFNGSQIYQMINSSLISPYT